MERITEPEIEEMRKTGCDRATIAAAEAKLEMCRRADQLIARIADAFVGVTLEDGIGLWQSDGIDDYRRQDELRVLRAKDEKLDWRRIPADDLNFCYAAPSFLDARGLLFHLPAFMTAELRGEFNQDFIGRLIYDSFAAREYRQLLTPAQRQVMVACISFYGSIDNGGYSSNDIANAILRFSTERSDVE